MIGMTLIALMPILRLVGILWTGRLLRHRMPQWAYWSLSSIHIPYRVGVWPLERISHLSRRRRIMETERMIIHPSFCASASRLMGMLWLPIWCSVLVGLWGSVRVEAQDASADRTPIFELHFDEDSLRVVRNEMSRTRRAGSEAGLDSTSVEAASRAPSAPRFPFQAVANNQAKKVVWFNADGTIRAQRSFSPQAEDIRVSENGAYVLVVHKKGGEGRSTDLELLDAQGTSLWRTRQYTYSGRYWSPTGETVVDGGGPETPELSFWSPQGQVAKYETLIISDPTFSADGRFLLVAERPLNEQYALRDTTFLSLFDKQGQRLWQRPLSRREGINNVFISESGQSMAYSYYDPDSYVGDTPKRYLSVLDHEGDIVWTQLAGKVYELSFLERLCCMKTGGAVLPLSRVIYAFLVIG